MFVNSPEACKRSSSHESMPTKKAANQEPFDFQFLFPFDQPYHLSHRDARIYL